MLGSSCGSVPSSLRRTSANDRSDEIFTCSTAMVCDAKVTCAVVWVMCALHMMGAIGFLNDLFYGRSYSGGPAELSIPLHHLLTILLLPPQKAGRSAFSRSRGVKSGCAARPHSLVWLDTLR